MDTYSPRRSSGPVLRYPSPVGRCNLRSVPTPPASSSFASATSSTFSAPRTFRRPISPPRGGSGSPSLSFSLDRPGSPRRSISMSASVEKATAVAQQRRMCMCSPTNHPGSFRCALHKSRAQKSGSQTASYGSSSSLNMRRSAMKNSLVRIGAVEGEMERRALAALIRPSSHQQRRRGEFRPRPSRLSVESR